MSGYRGYARGHVWIRDGVVYYGVYESARSDGPILCDNTGVHGWPEMLNQARVATFAVDRVLQAGHSIKTYAELLRGTR